MQHSTEACVCEGKLCRRCQEVKCVGHFYLQKPQKPGYKTVYRSYCKICDNERGGEKARLQRKETGRRWAKANPHKAREYRKRWGQRNPDRLKEYQEKYREKRRLYDKKRSKERYEKVKNTESYRARGAVARHRRRARLKMAEGNFTKEEWMALKAHYQYTCLCCHRKEPDIKLHADHVIPLAKGGSNYISNIQPLCCSCNTSKKDKTIDYRQQSNTIE